MGDLRKTDASYDPNGFYGWELDLPNAPSPSSVVGFDKHGYAMTKLEIDYAFINGRSGAKMAGCNYHDLRQEWMIQDQKTQGSILSHSFLLERKGYDRSAKAQLERWSKTNPVFNKLLGIKPRWGFSFSIDWIGSDGFVFEILNYEINGTNLDQVIDRKLSCEESFAHMDWDDAASRLMKKMEQWVDLDQVSQTHWKCDYLRIDQPTFISNVWI